MKINAVHLQNSCSQWPPDGITHRGFLYKKSESSRSFKKRWFVLRDNLLFYFSRKRSEESIASTPVGLIILEGCCVERIEGLCFQLTFPGSGERKYVLAAETEDEREEWMQAIVAVGFGFMQYAIVEMEKTVDALAKAEMDQGGTNATAASSIPDDAEQRGAAGCCPVRVTGGQATFLEDYSLPLSAVDESRSTGKQIPGNSRLIFERMHIRFREQIERKTTAQYKRTYAQQ